MQHLDPAVQQHILSIVEQADGGPRDVSAEEAAEILRLVDWRRWKSELLDVFLHQSLILEAIPESYADWLPVVHDFLLLMLDGLSDERIAERIVEQTRLPDDAPRSDRMLGFLSKTPTLQKIGQIIARNPALEADIRATFQTLENRISTTRIEEVLGWIEDDLGPKTIAEYQIEFADRVLAEASVGVVVPATLVLPGEQVRRRAVAKVIKPYALMGLAEELAALDRALGHFETHSDFYGIGDTPLVDMFEEIREALAQEILVAQEQRNLSRAAAYYGGQPGVVIPAVHPCSTENVTFMEFVHGARITDALPAYPELRSELARRLSDLLTYDVIYSEEDEAIFHGDPHAGNVMKVLDPGGDPYKIALIDWGLMGVLPRQQRAKLVQLLLGFEMNHRDRLANNMDALFESAPDGIDSDAYIRDVVEELFANHDERDPFEVLNSLIASLAAAGYSIEYNMVIFIKSQLTIAGILEELDPGFNQSAQVKSRMSSQVLKEMHVRLARTVWVPSFTSHDYKSMMSNADVWAVQGRRIGGFFAAIGRGIWKVVSFPFAGQKDSHLHSLGR